MSTEIDTEPVTESTPRSAFGLDENVAAAISYVPIVGLVLLFVEESGVFVRFHAAQSVVLAVAFVALGFVLSIVSIVLGFIPVVGTLFGLLLNLLYLAAFVGWLFLVYKAFSNERYEVPVVAGFAERLETAL